MTTDHPITPPPELVQQWAGMRPKNDAVEQNWIEIATRAAHWGADQELEECVSYVDNNFSGNKARALRAVRRSKPPSLKEQALEALDEEHADMQIQNYKLIRSVLESLPD